MSGDSDSHTEKLLFIAVQPSCAKTGHMESEQYFVPGRLGEDMISYFTENQLNIATQLYDTSSNSPLSLSSQGEDDAPLTSSHGQATESVMYPTFQDLGGWGGEFSLESSRISDIFMEPESSQSSLVNIYSRIHNIFGEARLKSAGEEHKGSRVGPTSSSHTVAVTSSHDSNLTKLSNSSLFKGNDIYIQKPQFRLNSRKCKLLSELVELNVDRHAAGTGDLENLTETMHPSNENLTPCKTPITRYSKQTAVELQYPSPKRQRRSYQFSPAISLGVSTTRESLKDITPSFLYPRTGESTSEGSSGLIPLNKSFSETAILAQAVPFPSIALLASSNPSDDFRSGKNFASSSSLAESMSYNQYDSSRTACPTVFHAIALPNMGASSPSCMLKIGGNKNPNSLPSSFAGDYLQESAIRYSSPCSAAYGTNGNESISDSINDLQTSPLQPTYLKSSNRKVCRCKKSQCLKKYCDCFAAGMLCGPECGCIGCHNDDFENSERQRALKKLVEKNPRSALFGNDNIHCNCQRSGCHKKYCLCLSSGRLCTDLCKCKGCANHGHL